MTQWTGRHVTRTLGGKQRTRVVVLLGAVLAMSSADTATVGASATQLRQALHISNTDVGLLVTASSLVGAVASIPFGIVADRFNRTRALGIAVILWGLAMLWSATASDFRHLLEARLALGFVTAAAGPLPASLIGDYFAADERGRIYGYLLSGELVGAGVGFAVTGDIAALSWRAAFVVLALPTFWLAREIFRLPEPERGGIGPLQADATTGELRIQEGHAPAGDPATSLAQRLAREQGIAVDSRRVLGSGIHQLGFVAAVRYILRVRTNTVLILASAFGYFFLAGVETFGVEFSTKQYHVPQAVANLLLLLIGVGAVVGTLVAGRLSDRLLQRGYLNARLLVAGIAALATAVIFLPAILTRSLLSAVMLLTMAALFLSAQNPPIDAARLDIVPSMLWGRAEGVRTTMRTGLQALAPLLFGAVSDNIFGGGRSGLQWTFVVMLVPLLVNGVLLLRALRTYPSDVATAAAGQEAAFGRRVV